MIQELPPETGLRSPPRLLESFIVDDVAGDALDGRLHINFEDEVHACVCD